MSLDIIKLLRKSPIFSALDSASLKKISVYLKEKEYSTGDILFKEGTLGDKLYIIKEGAIRIHKDAKEGEEESSQVYRREGEAFGEAGFLDEVPRSVTASADKPTKVLQLSRSNFLNILNQHPLIAYQIVKALNARLKQSDLRVIDDLKEKNEQLQKANLSLLKKTKDTEDQEQSESKKVTVVESTDVPGNLESISERMFSSISFDIILTDENDIITNFNQAAEKEFGYSSEETTGKPINILWDEDYWQDTSAGIRQKTQEQNFWEGEILAKKRNGESFVCSAIISEIYSPAGEYQGKLYLCQNVTESKGKEKEEWFGELSSERRFTAAEIAGIFEKDIKTLADVFEALPSELDEANSSRSMKTLTTIRNAIDGIKRMLSDLSYAPSYYSPKEPLDLTKLIQEELLLFQSRERFRDITFNTHLDKNIPQIEGDKNQLRKLLYIILENSVLALQPITQRKKAITLEVGSINKKQEVQIQILDNGIGISPADLPRVFKERFTTWKDGLGLGLLSANRIIKDHGGTIEIESDQGSYTLLVIKFPVRQEKPSPSPEVESVVEADR